MPRDARDTMSLRTGFVLFALQDGANIRALCRHYGISPATGYKWLRRWAEEGASGLQDRPRIPHHSPNWSSDDITDLLRMAHARHGLLPGTAPGTPAIGRFEYTTPNRLWQMDFKGHFPFGGGRCHPLTLLDDHSRFSLCLAPCTDERRETVQAQLVSVFQRYGLPDRMTMDNGSPWGDTTGTWTALELWLMRLGIRVGHSRPPEYDEGVLVRKVDISGKLSVKGIRLSAGKAFRNERVGLKETQEDGYYEVWWYSTKVGMIDLKKKSITMGKGC